MFLIEGTYASYKLSKESAQKLSDWIERCEIIDPVPMEDLHVTTTYSKADVDIVPSNKHIIIKKEDLTVDKLGRALVLRFISDDLQKIHDDAMDVGASYEYETYKPHITISYNAEANDNLYPLLLNGTLDKDYKIDFDITLSHEEVEPLKEEPANSTANIPVVPIPMKTFKMFRRKITEK